MRHLSVPKRRTEEFKRLLIENQWYAKGYRILSDEECTLIPISDTAPSPLPPPFIGIPIVEETQEAPLPNTWLEHLQDHLPQSVIDEHEGIWPNSQEQLGDLVIFKIDREVEKHAQQVALAKISYAKKARLVLKDLGVKGEFRVRELIPLAARLNGEILDADGISALEENDRIELTSTKISIKENGVSILLDPSSAYYSNRLAGERRQTVNSALELREALDREVNVVDPYCGVGPAILQLNNEKDLLNRVFATDLNQAAIDLFIERLGSVPDDWVVETRDALKLREDDDLIGRFDILLMNLPHDTLSHLPSLLPLLTKRGPRLVRGWAVVKEEEISQHDKKLNSILSEHGSFSKPVKSSIRRQYNSTMVLTRFEARFGNW